MNGDVETVLRQALVREAGGLAGPADPWPRFARREAAHRRARWARRAAAAGVLAVLVGVQTNVVPLPGWAPGIAIASRPAVLAEGPPRGGLAGDRTWLAGLRARVEDHQDPDGLWRVADRDAIKLVYAADVPGHRLALMLVPLRLGLIEVPELVFYEGPPGAAPAEMRRGSNTGADTPVVTWLAGDATDGGTAVVIGPAGSTVTISGGFRYSARGVVERDWRLPPTGDIGVARVPAAAVDPGVSTRVTDGDTVLYEGPVYGGWRGVDSAVEEPTPAMLAEAARGARGPALDPAVLASFVRSAVSDSRLSVREVTVRLRWVGTVNGKPAALLTLRPRGGGVLAYALHGVADAWRTDLRLLLPAAGADTRPLAWRMRSEGRDRRTDRVIVVAPPGAVTASVAVDGGPAAPVALDADGAGTATVRSDRPATVTAYGPDGAALASTPVPPFESDSGGLPGSTPGTRVVP
jgi:hypothetical protein